MTLEDVDTGRFPTCVLPTDDVAARVSLSSAAAKLLVVDSTNRNFRGFALAALREAWGPESAAFRI